MRTWISFLGIGFFLAFHYQTLAQQSTVTYPKIAAYIGIMHPLVTFSEDGAITNFKHFYVGGLPAGINIWKNGHLGFSMEFVPFIRADSTSSKMNNFLFHPGILVALGKGWTFAGRLAFETSGRYGITPILNKIVHKNKNSSYYVSVPVPARFGNNHSATCVIGLQFGILF